MTLTQACSIDTSKKPKHSVLSDTESSDSSDARKKLWIDAFFEQPYSDWFVKIPQSFTKDSFNTYGIKVDDVHAKFAYKQLSGFMDTSDDSFDSDSEDAIEKCTEVIYGLIHARYIFTPEGLYEMRQKYKNGVFGQCPRFLCKKQNLLPIGIYDKVGMENAKTYCPCCQQIYEPDSKHSSIDGAYFSKSFPHYFLLEPIMNDENGKFDGPMPMTSDTQSCRVAKQHFEI